MFVQDLTVLGHRFRVLFPNIVDCNNTIISSTGNKVWIVVRKLTCCYSRWTNNYLFREGRVFQCPEHEVSLTRAINVEITVGDGQQILIYWIPVSTRNRIPFGILT